MFSDHSRNIIHIHKNNNVTPNYLMMNLVSKNKSDVAHAQDLVVHIVVFGISGYHNDVPLGVWYSQFHYPC